MFYLVALLVFAVDCLIKYVVSTRIAPGGSLPLIKGIFHITYVRNAGVAFGLFPDQRLLLVLIGIAVCAAVIYFYTKIRTEDIYLALILGGSLGNLYDRIFLGYVVDYLDFRVFPVFNFADIAINLGVFLIIIDLLRGRK